MSEWYARFERDTAFRQAVIDSYGGRHEVGDALWWLDHPEATAPSGETSPLRGRAEIQRAAFARPVAPSVGVAGPAAAAGLGVDGNAVAHAGRRGGYEDGRASGGAEGRALAAQRELATLEAQGESDRRAAQAAVDAAEGALQSGRVGRTRNVAVLVGAFVAAILVAGGATFAVTQLMTGAGSGVAGAQTTAGPGDSAGGAPTSGEAGAGGGIADGGSSYSATGGASAPDAAAPTLEPFPTFLTDLGPDSFGAIFARPQSAADFAPGVLPGDLRGETFRVLNIGQNTSGAVYAAVDTNNQVCLVVYGNRETFGVSCATAAVVSARGLQVSLIAADHRDPTTGLITPAVGLSARWESDGRFTLDTSLPYDRD